MRFRRRKKEKPVEPPGPPRIPRGTKISMSDVTGQVKRAARSLALLPWTTLKLLWRLLKGQVQRWEAGSAGKKVREADKARAGNKPSDAISSYDKAVAGYIRAVKWEPQGGKQYNGQLADAYFKRANTHRALDQNQEAVEDYTQAIELEPEAAQPYYHRGDLNRELGKLEAAVDDYGQAISQETDQSNPQLQQAYYSR